MPHIEVLPNAKEAAAPGWAYVPDTGVDPSKAALNPTHPRRARNTAGAASGFELSARQLNAVQKRLAELDRDNTKEIAVPKSGDGAGQGRGMSVVMFFMEGGCWVMVEERGFGIWEGRGSLCMLRSSRRL